MFENLALIFVRIIVQIIAGMVLKLFSRWLDKKDKLEDN